MKNLLLLLTILFASTVVVADNDNVVKVDNNKATITIVTSPTSAYKLAVKTFIKARTTSSFTVQYKDEGDVEFIVTYIDSKYTLYIDDKNELESTRVSDIRAKILSYLE